MTLPVAGLKKWMESCGCLTVEELDWWQETYIQPNLDIKIVFLPAQHWSARLPPIDTNKVRFPPSNKINDVN